ncbi:Neutral/alkaline nonlysosomal ceramidase [Suillus bovinus]|uniref:Neutral/alkaline nonlysosomal ceramidase n=1 Tax=Suillus bovinus TaxID=48563 RepID=UPI001B881BC8|nr:Neutral/alkaline nonlysosomal ceramidase [Suillus bovinus]KAG2158746.1 Neutral/alkaline nonlysosomal ceramidase [Suillus bovinus]
MYLPSFSTALADSAFPFNWIYDAMHLFVMYLAAFFAASPQTIKAQGGNSSGEYLIGLGIGDVTGYVSAFCCSSDTSHDTSNSPVVETNMMVRPTSSLIGYAYLPQTDTGLHMRQRSRAFIVADASNPSERVLFINSDICMGDTGIRRTILSSLQSLYGNLYTPANTALVGTHAHSGVGGYLENLLPQVTSLGYVNATAAAIVSGTLKAIADAHNSLVPGNLKLGNTTLLNANRNRSPMGKAMYEGNQDTTVTVLGFDNANGDATGLLSFFPVHGTSLYENNTLVSGDNKGMAAWMYESYIEPSSMPGNNSFVAGFVQSNVGDTTRIPYCESPGKPWDGQPCEFEHSTCGNRTEDCHGRGPGFHISDFESNRIIGQAQFEATRTVMEGSKMTAVSGSVKSVTLSRAEPRKPMSLDHFPSHNASSSDGPGAFDFVQGDNSSQSQNPFWEVVKRFLTPAPSEDQIACHYPKPILLNSGYSHQPYDWSPGTVDVQMLRVGQFVILVMPGELTTIGGKEDDGERLIAESVLDDSAYVVIAGPANTYGHYVTTREEYGMQRYEGASTIFGPATLDAYIHKYGELVSYLGDNATGTSKAISLQTSVVVDNPPIFKHFGDVLVDVESSTYHAGDTVAVQFVGANPRNNLRLEGTFLTLDRQMNSKWVVVRTDSHPSTTYEWNRTSTVLGTSTVDIRCGTYRITYYGDSKSLLGSISAFTGESSSLFRIGFILSSSICLDGGVPRMSIH